MIMAGRGAGVREIIGFSAKPAFSRMKKRTCPPRITPIGAIIEPIQP